LSEGSLATLAHADASATEVAAENAERPGLAELSGQLAYVIFTSGSTGRPKGAMNEHRAVLNRLVWGQTTFDFGPGDRFLQKTPFSFDVSVVELFGPLLCGARLALAAPGGHQDASYLTRLIAEEEVTVVHFVPSMLGGFLDEAELSALRSVRRVMASGEALPAALADRFFARFAPPAASGYLAAVELHNLYGPTEAAVEVTHQICRAGSKRAPIGRPIANVQIHLLDGAGAPVPPGVSGELFIGGEQVGRGYLGRPDLTAERFVPGPSGSRLYRTGDLARHLADGAIEFLDRVDQQVKLRGFRIELEEIESALGRHPAIARAAVAIRGQGERRALVAYVVAADPEAAVGGSEVRAFLRRSLPEYMVPPLVVRLPSLPMTASGKIDRRLLPEPGSHELERERPFVAPRSALEEALALMWAEVLGI